MPRRKTKKKLPWTGFEITRVKLDPEQAVLSCCSQAYGRGFETAGLSCATISCSIPFDGSPQAS